MHRAGLRTTLVTLLVLSSLVVYSAAYAAVDVIYVGETPDLGVDWYKGSNYSDSLWDYVYNLSSTSGQNGPWAWGIQVDYAPESIWDDEDGKWTGQWYDSVDPGDILGDPFTGTALAGKPAVVWVWGGGFGEAPATGTFHFRSANIPALRTWVAVGGDQAYSGSGTQWSASPEPASMALTSLCLAGVAAWCRRRRSA